MDGSLALAVTDMRLAQVGGLVRRLIDEHPDEYAQPLSPVADLVQTAHGIVRTVREQSAADGPRLPEFNGESGPGRPQ